MEKLNYFIRKSDYFGVGLSFNYKSNKKYKSIYGGSIFILFAIVSVTYSVIAFYEYIIKRPITVIYYKKELPEIYILFKNIKVELPLKLTVMILIQMIMTFKNYLNLKLYFVKLKQLMEIAVPLKKFEYKDFYNLVSKEMDYNGIVDDYLCPENNNFTLSGTYYDEVFEYLEITLSIENETQSDIATKLLFEKECKLSYFFTDYL